MHRITLFTGLLLACSHDKLDFELPDGGRSRRPGQSQRDGGSVDSAGSASSSASSYDDAAAAAERGRDARDGAAVAGSGSAAGSSRNGLPEQGVDPTERYQDDPRGYPTGPGQFAESCAQGQSFDEVCANDIDEDCDGTVDEYPGIGEPCSSGCREGIYVCSASTNVLLCRGAQGCMNSSSPPATCGDGFLDSDEECDPRARSETPGATCTLTCERPLFIRCVDAGVAHPDRCDELHVCNERLGACMPVIGPRQPRCPQLPIEGSAADDEFYPMLETESGQCWVTCSEGEQCPSSLSDCYMGFCAVPL